MTPAQRMTDAARAWLDSLDDTQRAAALLPWPSDAERHRWNYTPVDHGGVPLGDLGPGQQSRAMRLVAAGLSDAGYATVATIMGLEYVLDAVEGWRTGEGRRRERHRDPQLYWLRIFGEPSTAGPWSWRFGGHHVSIQHLVADGAVAASTPSFLGADPAATALVGGHLLRPLAAAEDLARDLVRALGDRAILSPTAPADILSRNRPRVGPMGAPKGVAAGDMTADQRSRLRALLDVYVGRLPAELAEREAAKFAGTEIDGVHFAWEGGTEPGQPHYYRLHGPHLLAEYDNTQRDVNHIHTVWRDPTNDFGDDVLGRHLAQFH